MSAFICKKFKQHKLIRPFEKGTEPLACLTARM